MKIRYVQSSEINQILPMKNAIDCLRKSFFEAKDTKMILPARGVFELDTHKGNFGVVMPAYVSGVGFGVKISTVMPHNPKGFGLSLVNGLYVMFDNETGEPKIIMNGSSLTNLRTGAIGGLSIDILSLHESKILSVIGAGIQAGYQIEACLAVRGITQINIYSKTEKKSISLKNYISNVLNFKGEIIVANSIDEAVVQADIVIMATSTGSEIPLLVNSSLKDHCHICAIGGRTLKAREVDSHILSECSIFVDDTNACLNESREIQDLVTTGVRELKEIVQLQDLVHFSENELIDIKKRRTFFRSVGIPLQDISIASQLLKLLPQDVEKTFEL